MSLFCNVILYLEVLGNVIYIKQEKELREFSKGVFYMVKAALIAHALFGPEKALFIYVFTLFVQLLSVSKFKWLFRYIDTWILEYKKFWITGAMDYLDRLK